MRHPLLVLLTVLVAVSSILLWTKSFHPETALPSAKMDQSNPAGREPAAVQGLFSETPQPVAQSASTIEVGVEKDTVAQFSEEQRMVLLENYNLFSREELSALSLDPAFLPRLSDIAFNSGVVTSQNDYTIGKAVPRTSALDQESANRTRFSLDYLRIFAHFKQADFAGNEVLVKWSHVVSAQENEVIQLSRHAIAPQGTNNFFWAEQEHGWMPGQYRIEIFSADKELSVLARGYFEVCNNSQHCKEN